MLGAALARASDAPEAASTGVPRRTTQLPRGMSAFALGAQASLEEILFGPGRQADGTTKSSARSSGRWHDGYSDVKEFQRVEVVVSPYLGN